MFVFNALLTWLSATQLADAAPVGSITNIGTTDDLEWPSQWVQTEKSTLRVLVQGSGPSVLIYPSYGRDSGQDFNGISTILVNAGYKVLRPQPRGIMGSVGPMSNVTLDDLAADVAQVIDSLAGGRAIVFGHAFGTFVTKRTALNYSDKVPAIITAAPGAPNIPADIAPLPLVCGNMTLPVSVRLAALEKGFFTPEDNARIWLDGWYPETLAFEHAAIESAGDMTTFWAGANTTQVLEVIPAEDPFQPEAQWNYTINRFPDRATIAVVPDASHALFPENLVGVANAILPWVKMQSTRL
ncbi:Alpha/Beta hydrolase protein [Dactylonectria estremocensis]|uniref:Alpha/Beta hydrolase protein n=1 Tax=Dactylonectria estremocensis TaxID=1079267 RepID=A0A9P9DCM5_9HYPO|nr:Alpha/Beta hydrolase protein [Dactylonectria estremocensis]